MPNGCQEHNCVGGSVDVNICSSHDVQQEKHDLT
jgi:hypothetical protein